LDRVGGERGRVAPGEERHQQSEREHDTHPSPPVPTDALGIPNNRTSVNLRVAATACGTIAVMPNGESVWAGAHSAGGGCSTHARCTQPEDVMSASSGVTTGAQQIRQR